MNKRYLTRRHTQQGLTVVEIMVAMAISTLLILGIIQILIDNKHTYRMQEGMARLQENARFAMEFMTRDIRQAGYRGCIRSIDSIQNIVAANGLPAFKPTAGIQGWEFSGNGGAATAPGSTYNLNATDASPVTTTGNDAGWENSDKDVFDSIKVMRGSDIIRVWRGTALTNESGTINDIDVSAGIGKPFTININKDVNLNAEDIILVDDCQAADIMQVCNVQSVGSGNNKTQNLLISNTCTPGNNLQSLPASLALNSEFTKLKSGLFFVGKLGDKAENPPSLFYAELGLDDKSTISGRPQELIQGVDSMQILYGEDTDSDGMANTYVTAADVGNWNNIISVKIALLLRTVDEVDTKNIHGGTYEVNGTKLNLVVNDRRPRKVYSTTVVLRNRTI